MTEVSDEHIVLQHLHMDQRIMHVLEYGNEHTSIRTNGEFRGLCDGAQGSATRHDYKNNHSFCRRSVRKDEETDEENDGCYAIGTETVMEVGLDILVEDYPEIEQGDRTLRVPVCRVRRRTTRNERDKHLV